MYVQREFVFDFHCTVPLSTAEVTPKHGGPLSNEQTASLFDMIDTASWPWLAYSDLWSFGI